MLASFKQFSLLATPLLSHTSTLLWLRNSPRWCSAASPVSTLCLLALLEVLCLILASALSVLSVWPLVGRHNKLVHFPTYLVVEILGPGSWVAWAWRLSVPATTQLLPVNTSTGTETLGTALRFLGRCVLLWALFMVALVLPTLQPLQAPGKPPLWPCQSPEVCFPVTLWLAYHLLTEGPYPTWDLFNCLWDICRWKVFSLPTAVKACHGFLLQ